MTYQTWAFDTGICWQSGNGNNQLLVTDITENVNGDPTVYVEDSYVQTAADQIFTLFSNTGYYGHLENYMQNDNSYSTYANVLGDIYRDETAYPYSTFLYMGHGGNGPAGGDTHYFFIPGGDATQDFIGLPHVWDSEINQELYFGDHYFVFLWVCFNGGANGGIDNDGYTYGMPYSWTYGSIASSDGYQAGRLGNGPDSSGYSFISFQDASPMLSTYIGNGPDYGNMYQYYKYWLVFFYDGLLYYGDTVNQALDWASTMLYYSNFNSLPSYNGGWGNSVWWNGGGGQNPGWYSSIMREYGDGNIRIAPYSPW